MGDWKFELGSIKDSKLSLPIPTKILYQYQEQGDDLQFTIKAADGEVKFSRFIAHYSGFFDEICEKREGFKGGPICYNGEEGSNSFKLVTIRAFWDIAHGCNGVNLTIYRCLDLLRFLYDDGKLTASDQNDYEFILHTSICQALNSLNNSKRLLICTIISDFDNYDPTFEKSLAKDITFDQAKELAWGLKNPNNSDREIVRFYADFNDLDDLDEPSSDLAADVLTYTQMTFSEHYTETKHNSKLVVRSNEDDLLNSFNKGETLNVIFKDIKVTSDNDEVVGSYRQVGTHEDAPLYKRLTSPTMYLRRHKGVEPDWFWVFSQSPKNKGPYKLFYKTDEKSLPKKGFPQKTKWTTVEKAMKLSIE